MMTYTEIQREGGRRCINSIF